MKITNPYSKLNYSNKKYLVYLFIIGGLFGFVSFGSYMSEELIMSPFFAVIVRLVFASYYLFADFSSKRFNNITIIFIVLFILMTLNNLFS